ncbi:MAG: DUF4372 domain-containing protein [Flavobacteriaceae bacterium]|nr:DUF4372 domain-containing protein [Flavobacteriaceae bacterium]
MSKITLLAQMIQLLAAEKFKKLANELECNKHSKGIDSWTHLVTMLFCHCKSSAISLQNNFSLLNLASRFRESGRPRKMSVCG